MPEFGLPDATLSTVRRILNDHPAVEKAILYDSRAKGTYRPASDIDLTLYGEVLDLGVLASIAAQLEESSIPYQVDLSLWDALDHEGLREHIARVGVVFYERAEA
ncbi:MAG: nucleotidyltransferase domain-containing protein [Candidatus Hydrogenedentes bacterium]|nr:nucleotidyltransferase domain-containing protein [Candidatus Hydrogenedentota bacterium]